MSKYNPFPVSGQLNNGDKVYLGVHEMNGKVVKANTFRYVVYDPITGHIASHTGTADSITGELTFTNNNRLIIWTYEKMSSSRVAFYTDVSGEKKWLYTEKSKNDRYSPSKLSNSKVPYDTQGLPDLWAGYFGYFSRSDSKASNVRIDEDNPSEIVVAIPTVLYDRENACAKVDNSSGQALSLLIDTYRDNTPNTKIYSSNLGVCDSVQITYCQNQDVIYTYPDVNGYTHNPIRYCGQSLGTKSDGSGDDIAQSCLGTCQKFNRDKNNPVCYPGKTDLSMMSCSDFSGRRIFPDEGDDGDNSEGENDGSPKKPIYTRLWFIFLLVTIVVLVIIIIAVMLTRK